MRITVRRGFGALPEVVECEWPVLCTWLVSNAATQYTSKEDVPLWLPSATAQHQGPQGAANTSGWLESDQDPEGLWLAVLDFDDTPQDAWDRAGDMAKHLGPGLAHTTWQHGTTVGALRGDGTVRGRIILPFDRPVPLEAWPRTWNAIALAFQSVGATIDPQCKNANRCYWVPSADPKGPLRGRAWTEEWQAPARTGQIDTAGVPSAQVGDPGAVRS